MDTAALTAKFARIGARLKFAELGRWDARPVALNVRQDRRGEFFEVAHRPDRAADLTALDVRPAERHLLLLLRADAKQKLLCGHDERHWFVAGVPDAAPVGTVRQAMDALRPPEVQAAVSRLGLGADARNTRKNPAFVRQGEWFFLPAAGFDPGGAFIHRTEPLRRSTGGKPHWVDELVRAGGELVYVCRQHPNGLTVARYQQLLTRRPELKGLGWRTMTRNATVYVRGRVRHADHATVTLPGWHRVLMNTEGQSRAMANVAFLD